MTALPISANESAVRAAVERLSHVQPGAYQVVSCYLKLEPRDKTRGKYLIKIKNRIREALAALERQVLDRALRAQVAADLERVQAYFAEPTRLPPARGIALFACGALDLGVVRLNPKRVTATEVREAALSLREERERAWERAHAEAVREGIGTGWAVNGIEPTLKGLQRGQVRTLLADGQDDDRRIDDAIEEALAQRVQVDVVYDDRARRVVDGLAGLLRFRR